MKKIKAINGYTIYEATKNDTKKYNVEEGYFYIYFSSDIRDYGISNSEWDWEAGSIEEAEEWATGSNYAIAKEIVEERTTAATYEEIEEVEALLNAGLSVEEIEEEKEEKTMEEKIIAAFKKMEESEVIRIWNEYCSETNRYDDAIMDGYEMEEWINNTDDVLNVLNRFYFGTDEGNENTSANPNRNYFTFNGYGNIISFNYIYNSYTKEFYYLDIEDLAGYIVENENAFCNDEIEEILNGEQ